MWRFPRIYGWAIETLLNAVRPDTARGEDPELPKVEANRGMVSTAEVDYWSSREPREVLRSHLNYIVPDTQKWEQSAAYYIDTHRATDAFVKNAGSASRFRISTTARTTNTFRTSSFG